jgi:hypothetical protein
VHRVAGEDLAYHPGRFLGTSAAVAVLPARRIAIGAAAAADCPAPRALVLWAAGRALGLAGPLGARLREPPPAAVAPTAAPSPGVPAARWAGRYVRPGWTPLHVRAEGGRVLARVEGAPLLDAEGEAALGRLLLRHPGCAHEMPGGLVPVVAADGRVVALDGGLGRFARG